MMLTLTLLVNSIQRAFLLPPNVVHFHQAIVRNPTVRNCPHPHAHPIHRLIPNGRDRSEVMHLSTISPEPVADDA